MTTPLYVVTLYPYEDGSEARYQFDDLDKAQAFADKVNALPEPTRRYISGSGKAEKIEPWISSTYASVEEALEALHEWIAEAS